MDFDLNDLDDLDGDDISIVSSDSGISEERHHEMDADLHLENSIKQSSTTQTKLLTSKTLTDLLSQITTNTVNQSLDHSETFKLISHANQMTTDILTEIQRIHNLLRNTYTRFPELETTLPTALDFCRVVKEISNAVDVGKCDLRGCGISAQMCLLVTVACTTPGPVMETEELAMVVGQCDDVIALDAVRMRLLRYVESRMMLIAPNLCAIIGPYVGAQLMALAGSLSALSKIPACNIQVLYDIFSCLCKVMGKKESVGNGLSRVTQNRHAGFIYHSDLVQQIQQVHRSKATRIIAAKCALAVRCDSSGESRDGIHGMNMLLDIKKKFDKMLEPPPGKAIKALPIPLEGPKKKRAGRKVSKQKEKLATTELRKAQNRMVFGAEAEAEVGGSLGESVGLGMIGNASGHIRSTVAKKQKLSLGNRHKAVTERMAREEVGGFQTSLSSFTPVQGLAFENPDVKKEMLKDINLKWFTAMKKE